jgi:luciferase family oxidoreductase group 1
LTRTRIPLGVLDLTPVASGSNAQAAVASTLDLARHVEALGFHRYWLAEHHNAAALACTSPEIMIAAVAAVTRTMRVGSGGVMLPNHSPLRVAEAFRVLEALHPGRIDLGLGRAPGTDKKTALALRRSASLLGVEHMTELLSDLFRYLGDDPDPTKPFSPPKACPTGVAPPSLFLLGASAESAREAGSLGIGYAYANHFAPGGAPDALAGYREAFTPSRWQSVPRSILAVAAVIGETDDHASDLASSGALYFLRAGRGLRDLPLPSVAEAKAYPYDEDERALLACQPGQGRAVIGGPTRARAALESLLTASHADELMVTTMVHDPSERRASYARLARLFS